MGNKDAIGDRIKRYERAGDFHLPPRQSLCIRVDGKAFHTYTRSMTKPFDHNLMRAMRSAMIETSKQMQGFKLAYHQSDEVTFLLTDYDKFSTQGWFDYELNKVVSVSASLFTAYFNDAIGENHGNGLAIFDSRAFVVPQEDVPNVFVWRQKDWARNSVRMLGQATFSHRDMQGKSTADIKEMLWAKQISWEDCRDDEKYGSFLTQGGTVISEQLDYYTIADMIKVPEEIEVDDEAMA